MKHTIEHPLDIDMAKKVANKAFEAYAERFDKYKPTVDWTGDYKAEFGFEAKGVKIGGNLELRDKAIDVEMSVPFVFKPFRKRAMDVVEGEIEKWITKAKNGELDD